MKPSLAPAVLALTLTVACGEGVGAVPDAGVGAADAQVPAARGQFPEGFLWGTSVASYPSEGGLHATDWYQWESEYCSDCAQGQSADDGPNFWDNYSADLSNAASLSTTAIRLGIDWSRVFPTAESFPDAPDAEAVAHYHAILTEAHSQGLNPMVTLFHFALPVWMQDLANLEARSGWEDPATIEQFSEFARWAAGEYGDQVDYWITINDPITYALGGWIFAETPPGKRFDGPGAIQVIEHLIHGHARAYDAIQETDLLDADGDGTAALVSIAQQARVLLPKDPDDPAHQSATERLRYLFGRMFLDAVVSGNIDRNFDLDFYDADDVSDDDSLKGRLDFIGLNYYGLGLVAPATNDNSSPVSGVLLLSDLDQQGVPGPLSELGWTIYPAGLREVLDDLQQYGLPIMITGNGVADGADLLRPRFLAEHLYVLNVAIDDGVDIRGYFHRSLTDTFEWTRGFCPRFGLYRVDYSVPERTRVLGEGAEVYRRIIDDNTVDPQMFVTYPDYPEPATTCPRPPL